jgi:hypothetical protein
MRGEKKRTEISEIKEKGNIEIRDFKARKRGRGKRREEERKRGREEERKRGREEERKSESEEERRESEKETSESCCP